MPNTSPITTFTALSLSVHAPSLPATLSASAARSPKQISSIYCLKNSTLLVASKSPLTKSYTFSSLSALNTFFSLTKLSLISLVWFSNVLSLSTASKISSNISPLPSIKPNTSFTVIDIISLTISGNPLPLTAYTSISSTFNASSIFTISDTISAISTSPNFVLRNSTTPPSALKLSISSITPTLNKISTIFAFTSNFSPLFLLLQYAKPCAPILSLPFVIALVTSQRRSPSKIFEYSSFTKPSIPPSALKLSMSSTTPILNVVLTISAKFPSALYLPNDNSCLYAKPSIPISNFFSNNALVISQKRSPRVKSFIVSFAKPITPPSALKLSINSTTFTLNTVLITSAKFPSVLYPLFLSSCFHAIPFKPSSSFSSKNFLITSKRRSPNVNSAICSLIYPTVSLDDISSFTLKLSTTSSKSL